MRKQITLYDDQYAFYKELKSKRLLVAFVEYMFEDVEPTGLNKIEKVVRNSLKIRMENQKKKSDAGSQSHGGGRKKIKSNTSSELGSKNNTKTTEQTTKQTTKEQQDKDILSNDNILRERIENNVLSNDNTIKEKLGIDGTSEERKEKKKRKKVEYTEDFENIWKIYPQNGGVKEKIFPIWQNYDDDKKDKLLFGAKTIKLRAKTGWKYIQRMDRWMEGYTPGEEFEKLCDVKRTIDNLNDDELKKECYHELKEMFGDEMNKKVAFATVKKMKIEWH